MILPRRRVLEVGGVFLAALAIRPSFAAGEALEVLMQGTANGSRVWFDPIGLQVRPGQTVRWSNRDPGNSHTVTAYHPSIFGRPQRIPDGAAPWDSGYLLPDQSFEVTFSVEGVYDYYCVPHEHAGMVGRIVVGTPPAGEPNYPVPDATLTAVPEVALGNFPSVENIIAKGMVHRG
jgi:plastocyanin